MLPNEFLMKPNSIYDKCIFFLSLKKQTFLYTRLCLTKIQFCSNWHFWQRCTIHFHYQFPRFNGRGTLRIYWLCRRRQYFTVFEKENDCSQLYRIWLGHFACIVIMISIRRIKFSLDFIINIFYYRKHCCSSDRNCPNFRCSFYLKSFDISNSIFVTLWILSISTIWKN